MLKKIQFFSLFLLLSTQIIIGFIVVPLIFKYAYLMISPLYIAKNIAGNISGKLFHCVAYINIFTILILFFTDYKDDIKKSPFINTKNNNPKKYLLIFSLFLITINEFFISKIVRLVKLNKSNWFYNLIGGDFSIWHNISKYIFIITVIICLIYAFFWIKENLFLK